MRHAVTVGADMVVAPKVLVESRVGVEILVLLAVLLAEVAEKVVRLDMLHELVLPVHDRLADRAHRMTFIVELGVVWIAELHVPSQFAAGVEPLFTREHLPIRGRVRVRRV